MPEIKITDIISVGWRLKYYFISAFILLAIGALFYSKSLPNTYVSNYTFVVDESSGNTTGLGGIIGQLGLGSLNPTGFNLERVIEYGKSRYVIKNALQDSIFLGNESNQIANYLLDYLKLKENWAENPNGILSEFSAFNSEIDDRDRVQSAALQSIYGQLIKGASNRKLEYKISRNVSTGIFEISITSEDEILSYTLATAIFNSLRNVYTKEALEKELAMSNKISIKLDSINSELRSLENGYSRYLDRQNSVLLQSNKDQRKVYERDIFLLTSLQQDIARNLETTKFKILTLTPAFKPIDPPILPLPPNRISTVKMILVVIVLSCMIYFFIILFMIFYKNWKSEGV